MEEVKQDTVEMIIPVEQTHEVDQQGKVKCLTCSQILDNLELFNTHYTSSHGQLPTSNPQEETVSNEVVEVKAEEIPTNPQEEEKPQRNEKGQFAPGNNASEGSGGRPCGFCEKRTEIMNKIKLYSEWTLGNVDKKLHVPYLEELCDETYLDIHTDTLTNWTDNAHDVVLHTELIATIKKLKMRQKRLLLMRTLGQVSTGAIFQLKANHGMIETEKQMMVGGNNNDSPVKYDINIIPKKKREELEGE